MGIGMRLLAAFCLFTLGCQPGQCPGNLPLNITSDVETEIEHERPIATQLKEMGAKVMVDTARPGKPVVGVDLTTMEIRNEVSLLKTFTQLETLSLARTNVSDEELVHLRCLTGIRRLWLNSTRIGDAGMVHLRELAALEDLYLTDTRVSKAGILHLKGLTKLHTVTVDSACLSEKEAVKLQTELPVKALVRY